MIKIKAKEVGELINRTEKYVRIMMHREGVSMKNHEQVVDFISKHRFNLVKDLKNFKMKNEDKRKTTTSAKSSVRPPRDAHRKEASEF